MAILTTQARISTSTALATQPRFFLRYWRRFCDARIQRAMDRFAPTRKM